jgi:hypothetical protein
MKYDHFTRWCDYFTSEIQARYGGSHEDALRRATALLRMVDGRSPRNGNRASAARLRRRRPVG